MDSEIAQVVGLIAEARGWDPRLSVHVDVVGQDQIIHSMLADVHAQIPPKTFRAQQDFLAAFGWIPPEFDFESDVLGLFAREVSGVYCVTSQRILLAENSDKRGAKLTLRHELVHAFQDSRYDLSARTQWDSDRGDYVAAIHALAEGEATCIELQLDDPHHLGCMDPAFDDSRYRAGDGDWDERLLSVPRVVRHSLYAPYINGVRYVRRLLLQGGWTAVERAWRGNLQSTRALFRDAEQESLRLPVTELPASVGQCQLQFIDMVGEESLRSFVGDNATPSELDSTLSTLDGERVAAWQCQAHCVAAMRLHFRDATGAAAYAGWLSGSWGMERGDTSCLHFGTRTVSLQRHGQDIAVASVRPCHALNAHRTADNCPQVVELTSRLADFHL